MDVSSIATAYTAFSEVLVGFAWARRAMTTARRSPASHALHCLRLPGRRSGSQSAQSWPISAHLRRDCERPIMAMNRWLPVTAHRVGTLPCPPMLILPGLHAESAEIIRHCR